MLLLIKVMAIQLACLACMPVYCAARQQLFFSRPMNKIVAWSLFVVLSLISVLLFCQLYHPLTAIIYFIVLIMLGWILLALLAPYYREAKTVLALISILMLLPGLLGGVNVA